MAGVDGSRSVRCPDGIQKPVRLGPEGQRDRTRHVPHLLFPLPRHAGAGGRGPDLTRGTFSVGDRDSDLFRVNAFSLSPFPAEAAPILLVENADFSRRSTV